MSWFRDINAPDTSWRGTEDPIPVVFGRYPLTAFLYRWFSARPLDGHARTDATFFKAGHVDFTKNGKARGYQFWPGWKRGLVYSRSLPLLTPVLTEQLLTGHVLTPALLSAPHLIYGSVSLLKYMGNREHEKYVLKPITSAAMNIVRSRDVSVEIPKDTPGSDDPTPYAGKVWLPVDWTGSDGDREKLSEMLNERLRSPISLSFDMAGDKPSATLSIPKQPPSKVNWDDAVSMSNEVSPYLGESAQGAVNWDLADDSPHIAVPGGGGSGKSELCAWIIGQKMRGGAGLVVLDPKYASHRWAMNRPDVLYAADPETLHEVVLWLARELARRGLESQKRDQDFPCLMVLLEERNSMQDLLRAHWRSIRVSGDPIMSPALTALDVLASQGRSLNINIVLAAQATAQVDIGKRNNYGAFAIAGRLPANAWKLAGASKPAITGKPGRFGYLTNGHVTVFQAAFPDVRNHPERFWEWASGGQERLDTVMLYQQGIQSTPSSDAGTTSYFNEDWTPLSDFAREQGYSLPALQKRKKDNADFPDAVGRGPKNAALFVRDELLEWHEQHEPDGGWK